MAVDTDKVTQDAPFDAAKLPLAGRKPPNLFDDNKGPDSKNEEGGKSGRNNDSSLKIKIELDLDVEVHLTARIKGDITIGLL